MRSIAAGTAWILVGTLLGLGCSSSEEGDKDADPSGGTGASASGGNSTTGGTSGNPGVGGQSSTGGNASTGGDPGTGGGETSTGGDSGIGGTDGSGGTLSSGCGLSGSPTGEQERTLSVGGTERTFVLSVPDSYDPSVAMPIVFAWHGLGGSGSLARRYFQIEGNSNGQAIFVYPDGLPNNDGQAAWDLAADGIDVAFFDALVDSLSAEYCVDASRLFSTGHSYGGFFTNRLGCSRAEELRAIAPVAGGPPWGPGGDCSTGVAAWITHGSNDETVDFSSGEDSRDLWASNNQCDSTTQPTTPSPCVAFDGCADGLPVHWCVHEDGHNWPSFAGSAIWEFFASL